MKSIVVSLTNPAGTADTTLNDGVNWQCFLADTPLIPPGKGVYVARGDGQQPELVGVSLDGFKLALNLKYLKSPIDAGFDLAGTLFDVYDDKTTRTLILKNTSDGNRLWFVTGRILGLGPHRGNGNITAYMALDDAVQKTVLTETETTWPITTAPDTHAYTIDVGNVSTHPIIELSANLAGGNGQRYCQFVDTHNWTLLGAPAFHVNITGGSGLNTTALINYTAVSIQVNVGGGINNNPATVTIPYDTPVGGANWTGLTLPFPMYHGTEQILITARTGGPTYASGNLTVTRNVNGGTIQAHADNAVFALSLMALDGRDIRVKLGNGNGNLVEVPYWLSGINTTATKIWISKGYTPKIYGTLAAAVNIGDTSVSIDVVNAGIDTTNGVFAMGEGTADYEAGSYASFNAGTHILSGIDRASKDGTESAHAAGDPVYFIDDLWIYYGDPLATAPVYSDQTKPPFSLASADNVRTFLTFGASSGVNVPDDFFVSKNATTAISYTTAQDLNNLTPTSPWPVIGASVQAKNDSVIWQVTMPFGWTQAVAQTVERYNLPASQGFLRSMTTADQVAITAQTAVNTWSAPITVTLTPSATSTGFQFYLKNTQTAAYARRAAVDIGRIDFTLSTSTTSNTEGIPYVYMGARQVVEVDVNTIITNQTNGDSFQIIFPNLALGQKLTIDTGAETVVYSKDHSQHFGAIQPYKPREYLLSMIQGSNTLYFSQANMDFVLKWQGRNNVFG